MEGKIRQDNARVVPIGPHTNHPGNQKEIWTPGYGVEFDAMVGIYTGTVIVPFAALPEAEGFLREMQASTEEETPPHALH